MLQVVAGPATGTGRISVSLAGLAAGEYFVDVERTGGSSATTVPQYTLSIDAPGTLATSDWAGHNDQPVKAYDLGQVANLSVFSGLTWRPARPTGSPSPRPDCPTPRARAGSCAWSPPAAR